MKREKEELRSSLETELEKAHTTKLEHEDEFRSLKENETKVNEIVMESKSSDIDQLAKLQNTLSIKRQPYMNLKKNLIRFDPN